MAYSLADGTAPFHVGVVREPRRLRPGIPNRAQSVLCLPQAVRTKLALDALAEGNSNTWLDTLRLGVATYCDRGREAILALLCGSRFANSDSAP